MKPDLPITQGFANNLLRSDAFKNVRGTALRDGDKTVRCGTHMVVLKRWVEKLKPDPILEHGAGIHSTPYLKELDDCSVLTIEDVARWREEVRAGVSYDEWDAKERFDLVLVDGPAHQRAYVVEASMIAGSLCIIEHDAEAWSTPELDLRMRLCSAYKYHFQQETSQNPETAVMLHSSVSAE